MRTYVNAEDIGFGAKFEYGPFNAAMQTLLKNIIAPEFVSISQDFYLDAITDINNDLYIECRIHVDYDEVVPNHQHGFAEYDSVDFMKKFLKIYNHAMENITDRMRYVSDKDLNDAGLSEDQFIIQLKSLEIIPNVRVFQEDSKTKALFTHEILITLIVNMEDISGLQPGGLEMLYLKYKNLCLDQSGYSVQELKDWVLDLKYKPGSKHDMCQKIKHHYGF